MGIFVPKITRKLYERLQPEGWKACLVESVSIVQRGVEDCAISEGSDPRFLFIHSNWGLAHHPAPSQRNEHQSPCPPAQIEKTVSRPRPRLFLLAVTWWIIMLHTVGFSRLARLVPERRLTS